MEKIIEEKIKELKSEKRKGIDDIVRLGQITVLQEILIKKFMREAK